MGTSGEILPADLPVFLGPDPNRSIKCLPDCIISLRRYPDAKGFDGLFIFIQPALESQLVPQSKGLGIGIFQACNGAFPCSILQDNAGGPQLFRKLRQGKRRRKYQPQDGQAVFFENDLLRGNRTSKINADNFNAFRSYNYPALAHAGIYIKYDLPQVYHPVSRKPLKPHYLLDRNIAILKLFPGISPQVHLRTKPRLQTAPFCLSFRYADGEIPIW